MFEGTADAFDQRQAFDGRRASSVASVRSLSLLTEERRDAAHSPHTIAANEDQDEHLSAGEELDLDEQSGAQSRDAEEHSTVGNGDDEERSTAESSEAEEQSAAESNESEEESEAESSEPEQADPASGEEEDGKCAAEDGADQSDEVARIPARAFDVGSDSDDESHYRADLLASRGMEALSDNGHPVDCVGTGKSRKLDPCENALQELAGAAFNVSV